MTKKEKEVEPEVKPEPNVNDDAIASKEKEIADLKEKITAMETNMAQMDETVSKMKATPEADTSKVFDDIIDNAIVDPENAKERLKNEFANLKQTTIKEALMHTTKVLQMKDYADKVRSENEELRKIPNFENILAARARELQTKLGYEGGIKKALEEMKELAVDIVKAKETPLPAGAKGETETKTVEEKAVEPLG